MTQAPEQVRPAGGPPPGVQGAGGPPPGVGGGPGGPGGPPDFQAIAKRYLEGHVSGVEGRLEEFARGVIQVINTIKDTVPYEHEMNDALVKAWLLSIQFAKDQNLLKEFCDKDIEVMRPVNVRMGQLIAATGEKELALEAVAGYSPCHYHLVLETWKEPGLRRFRSPFKRVLDAGRGVGQFDLTEQYIHEEWFIPRHHGFAKDLGVEFEISPWQEDGMITISVK